jgi:hypothetical protein
MENKILKFNENWFRREKPEELKPMGTVTTVDRPKGEINRLSDSDMEKIKKTFSDKKLHEPRINPYFIQEISDRLYGPDSDEYIKELTELNKRFRPRPGRTGHDIFKGEN